MTVPVNSPDQSQLGPPQTPSQREGGGPGVASLVVGVLGTGFGLVPFLFWISGPLGVSALVLGLLGLRRARRGRAATRKLPLAGIVAGTLATALGIVGLAVSAGFAKEVAHDLKGGTSASPSKSAAAPAPGPSRSASTPPVKKQPFGATYRYPDGVEVTVSKPVPYTPDKSATGHRKGNKEIRFTVTIVNGSQHKIDITSALPTVLGSDGIEADAIYDNSHATTMFAGALEPGREATGAFAFSLPPGTRTVDLQIGPQTVKYDEKTWSGPLSG
ncbi:hypothetical protein ACFYMW_20855 [Streptomyces sp. NPDC006692]|uniref:hypothetical protein n=1 Tax=unclassified Streptomyces TaxID=2593676 RepID=UPI0036A2EB19